MTQKKTLIWDIGRVLVDWDRSIAFSGFNMPPDKLAWFSENVASIEHFILPMDGGESVQSATQSVMHRLQELHPDKLAEYPDAESMLLGYPGYFLQALTREMPGSRAMRDHLRAQGHPTYALSNFAADLFELSLTKYPWLNQGWDGMVVSGYEKVVKPDPRIYELLLSRYQIDPVQAVFIDDSLMNVETARKLGIDSIRYEYEKKEAPALLKAELLARGFNLPADMS